MSGVHSLGLSRVPRQTRCSVGTYLSPLARAITLLVSCTLYRRHFSFSSFARTGSPVQYLTMQLPYCFSTPSFSQYVKYCARPFYHLALSSVDVLLTCGASRDGCLALPAVASSVVRCNGGEISRVLVECIVAHGPWQNLCAVAPLWGL